MNCYHHCSKYSNLPKFMTDKNGYPMTKMVQKREETTASCTQGYYCGYPTQVVANDGDLMFLRYTPASTEEASTLMTLPRGTYQITCTVNASPAKVTPPPETAEGDLLPTATVGFAPKINGVLFPRGGGFATIPYGFGTIGSASLSGTCMVTLGQAVNTIAFTNTAKENFATDFQLLNITITKICN